MWTHKHAYGDVKNWPGNSSAIKLCDQNIGDCAYDLGMTNRTVFNVDSNIRYYRITKSTTVYD